MMCYLAKYNSNSLIEPFRIDIGLRATLFSAVDLLVVHSQITKITEYRKTE